MNDDGSREVRCSGHEGLLGSCGPPEFEGACSARCLALLRLQVCWDHRIASRSGTAATLHAVLHALVTTRQGRDRAVPRWSQRAALATAVLATAALPT